MAISFRQAFEEAWAAQVDTVDKARDCRRDDKNCQSDVEAVTRLPTPGALASAASLPKVRPPQSWPPRPAHIVRKPPLLVPARGRRHDGPVLVERDEPVILPGRTPKLPVDPARVRVRVLPAARLILSRSDTRTEDLLAFNDASSCSSQLCSDPVASAHELVLGLDFGTSCAKVVVGDLALKKAFAVPFCRPQRGDRGFQAYLLPARLFEVSSEFFLHGSGTVHRDLKLSLLASPESEDCRMHAVAYLALVIRRARAWLFTEHSDIYRHQNIVWRLALGIPVDRFDDSNLFKVYQTIGFAAWAAAGADEPVSIGSCKRALELASSEQPGELLDLEVNVVPEITAQVYGFVISDKFDKTGPNIFLMADVGAGTVDASLFHVKAARRGKHDFEIYTSVVSATGVMNLHRHRVSWWQEKLAAAGGASQLLTDLSEIKFQTDDVGRLPESFKAYFDNVETVIPDKSVDPDWDFFSRAIAAQVQGAAFWRAWKNDLLPKGALQNVPFFLCGGGSRMAYYQKLKHELEHIQGCTWLSAVPRQLSVPDNFIAPGLEASEYDRLTVAYGLCFLNIGEIKRALPDVQLRQEVFSAWRENYIDN